MYDYEKDFMSKLHKFKKAYQIQLTIPLDILTM